MTKDKDSSVSVTREVSCCIVTQEDRVWALDLWNKITTAPSVEGLTPWKSPSQIHLHRSARA